MALNLFSARNSFVYGDARAVLERVVIFVGRQAEESFGEFVVERYKFGYAGVEMKFFHLNFIKDFFIACRNLRVKFEEQIPT